MPDADRQLRRNFGFDAMGALGTGVFNALVVNFLSVIARREGADPLLLAALAAAPFAANTLSNFYGLLGSAPAAARQVRLDPGDARPLAVLRRPVHDRTRDASVHGRRHVADHGHGRPASGRYLARRLSTAPARPRAGLPARAPDLSRGNRRAARRSAHR